MPQPGTFLSRATHVRSMERKKVGEVFHFFGHIGVAAIKLTDGSLAVGDTVQIQGPTTNLEQPVDSLQIEHGAVSNAAQGQEVGKVRDRVREKDFVYKLVGPSEAAPAPKTAARKPVAKKAPPKKARPKKRTEKKRAAKKRRAKSPTRARKASRAPRKKARPSSRKSRRRSR